jgi:putative membrane protein
VIASPESTRQVSPAALTFALLGGAFAWLFHLMGMYALHPLACARGSISLMIALTVVMALITVAAGVVAWAHRNAVADDRVARGRARFMARAGLALDILFLYIIVAESLPLLYDGPCTGFEVTAGLRAAGGGLVHLILFAPGVALAHVGPVPAPEDVWSTWTWDPYSLPFLLTLVAVYARGQHRMAPPAHRWTRHGEPALFSLGVLALALALLSPLDAVSEALFSMHMLQHLLLTAVAAPLLAFAGIGRRALAAAPRGVARHLGRSFGRSGPLGRAFRQVIRPAPVAALHLVALWAWHLPALYEAALDHELLHLLEHASFLGTAGLLWVAVHRVLREGGAQAGALLLAVFLTALHSGLLGSLITLAPMPWYPSHAGGVEGWGRTPLEDQQLAGLLMWIPSAAVYLIAALALAAAWIRGSERRVRQREARLAAPGSGTARRGA